MFAIFAITAVCLSPPVNGEIVQPYSPVGQFGGHWGVDYEARLGEPVRAPVGGLVTFAGSVAGMISVTIEPIPDLKVSLSYLQSLSVASGTLVEAGDQVGTAGVHSGRPSVHMSTRIAGKYVDPAGMAACLQPDISRALRLLTPDRPYPRPRANRNSRRHLRPDPHRASSRR